MAPAAAQEEKAEAIPATPLIKPQEPAAEQKPVEGEFEALKASYDAAYQAWVAKIMAMSDEERKKGYPDPPAQEWFPKFKKLADGGDIGALAWVLDNYYYSGLGTQEQNKLKRSIMKQLASHADHPAAADALAGALMYDWEVPPAEAIKMLENIIAKSKDHAALGHAHFSLAQVLMREGSEASAKRAIQVLEIVSEKYADTFYGRFAKGLIFEAQNLQVGMVAPNFSGMDVHGKPIALADYRGKVTFLIFWGFW